VVDNDGVVGFLEAGGGGEEAGILTLDSRYVEKISFISMFGVSESPGLEVAASSCSPGLTLPSP